ncbi:hypothetical protein ACWD6K_30780 [Streptomyces sp. NPDC002431]
MLDQARVQPWPTAPAHRFTTQLVQTDEETVRNVLHRFNGIGPAAPTRSGRKAVPACSA